MAVAIPASDFLRTEWTKYAFTSEAMGTRPSSWYVALLKEDGTEVASGTDDSAYARQSVTFATGDPGRATNTNLVSFPAAGAGADYEVHGFAIYDAATDGQLLIQQDLETAKVRTEGKVLAFDIGDLIVGVGRDGS